MPTPSDAEVIKHFIQRVVGVSSLKALADMNIAVITPSGTVSLTVQQAVEQMQRKTRIGRILLAAEREYMQYLKCKA